MISVALLSVLQLASAQAQPAPELRRDEMTFAGPQFHFPDEIAPMMFEYLKCLNPREGLRSDGAAGFEAALGARMQACRPTRDWAVASAVRVYKRDRKAPGGAREQLTKIFDDVDAAQLLGSRHVDEQFRARTGLPAPKPVPAKPDDAQRR